jgi:hypothetical protein
MEKRRQRLRRAAASGALRERMSRWRKTQAGKRFTFARNLRKYGLTVEDVARMYHQQNRCCASCSTPLDLDSKAHIDHDHGTGKIRGILCRNCNLTLGLVHESIAHLLKLVDYLKAKS